MFNLDKTSTAAILTALRLMKANVPEAAPAGCDIDALCARIQGPYAGELHNWNAGQTGEGPDASPQDVLEDACPYQISHAQPTHSIDIDIFTSAPEGTQDSGFWSVSVELVCGLPVVRCHRPGNDEPLNEFRFPALDLSREET